MTEPQGGAQPPDPQSEGPAAGETPAESPAGESPTSPPPARWYQKAPGYPLTTDDPAARGRKVAMLTFDDGPNPGTTEQILDVLKQYNVRAVFFVTGYGARHTDLLRRIAAEGHIIGTHTMTHANLRELSREEQRREIVGVNEMVEAATGQKVRYFRPPFGAYNEDTLALMEELGLELINWSHGSRDWLGVANGWKDPALVVRDVLAEEPPDPQATRLHPGAIILLHDTLPHTAAALPAILEGLAEKGYELVTLEP
ncbi:MAG: polysaccharide deacetylase family protein [Bacillota bacterium]